MDVIYQFQILSRALDEDFPEHCSINPTDVIVQHSFGKVPAGAGARQYDTFVMATHSETQFTMRTHSAYAGCYRGNTRGEKKRNTMKRSYRDQVEVSLHEAKGKAKETVAKLINNSRWQAEDNGEKIARMVQNNIGKGEKIVEK
ncbi:MAG: hypothetical protein ACYC9L_08600 [Sulfuricaulis sp.]